MELFDFISVLDSEPSGECPIGGGRSAVGENDGRGGGESEAGVLLGFNWTGVAGVNILK
jgi:hypothetical protein